MGDTNELLERIDKAIQEIRILADETSLDGLVWEARHVDWPNVEGPAWTYAMGQAQSLVDAVALAQSIRTALQAGVHRTAPTLD